MLLLFTETTQMCLCVYSKQPAATARSPEEEEVHTLGVEDFELALATDVKEEEKKSETEDG